MPTSGPGLAAVTCAVVFIASCAGNDSAADDQRDPGGRLTASDVRACLDQRPGKHDGLLFRTTSRSSDNYVGVIMMDLTATPARMATVGIAIYDDADLLDAYEERARQDPTDEVARVKNAVVSYHGAPSEKLALGDSWVQLCLRDG